jgi:hypothetical protein
MFARQLSRPDRRVLLCTCERWDYRTWLLRFYPVSFFLLFFCNYNHIRLYLNTHPVYLEGPFIIRHGSGTIRTSNRSHLSLLC